MRSTCLEQSTIIITDVFLYDDSFRTKETLSAGNYLSVINVLMQLRKV